jgi:hypothetical protein
MGIARPHRCPTVLKYLDVADPGYGTKLRVLLSPHIDDPSNAVKLHLGKRQIMAWRVADHATETALALRYEQLVPVELLPFSVRQQGGKVVVEDEGLNVGRIAHVTRSLVARAEIAGGIVDQVVLSERLLEHSSPGAGRAMWRDQHPLSSEQIQAAVRGREAAGPIH